MGDTKALGRRVVLNQPAPVIYGVFSDLRHFATNLPSEIKDKSEIKFDADYLLAKVHGFELGIKIEERSPFNFIKFVQYDASPVNFDFWVRIEPLDQNSCAFRLELDAQLGTMMKMMVGGKVQEAIDKLTDELEKRLA
jgi:ribosome-associated translation inhibitor RaiA